jgi:hypothetical protein
VLYTIRTVELFAELPGGTIALVGFVLVWVVLFFAGLFGLTFGWQ